MSDPRWGSDPGRTGLPFWTRRDTGPVNTYVPGPLLPTSPLHNTFDWRVRAIGTGILLAIVSILVVSSSDSGKVATVLLLTLIWGLYAFSSWWKGQAGLRVVGDRAEVRVGTRTFAFTGADVDQVRQVYNGKSPDFRLLLNDGRRVYVAASRLDKGHSTLYEWLRRFAPQASYDKGAERIGEMLRSRGLIAPTADEPESGPRPVDQD